MEGKRDYIDMDLLAVMRTEKETYNLVRDLCSTPDFFGKEKKICKYLISWDFNAFDTNRFEIREEMEKPFLDEIFNLFNLYAASIDLCLTSKKNFERQRKNE